MKITAESRSDQWNADDFLGGPRTFVISGAREGKAEAAFDITFEGEEKVWRPPVTVRKILTNVWGTDESDDWIGRRVRLYRDPTVRSPEGVVGGIRLSHMSHLKGTAKVVLNSTRGKRALHTVEPLPDVPVVDVGSITDQNELRDLWQTRPDLQDAIKARVNELKEQS